MQTIKFPAAIELINTVAIEMDIPVMLHGQPGVGKSELMAQIAASHNAPLVDIRLSQYDSVDLRGIPSVKDVSIPAQVLPGERLSAKDRAALATTMSVTAWNVPSTLPFKGNPRFDASLPCIILFLDEFNSAQLSTLAVAYQLVNDRAVGEHQLMDNVRIVCAGNRDGDKGVTTRMPTPLANRLVHAELGLDVDAVCTHFTKIGMPAVGVAFLQFCKEVLSTFMVERDGNPVVTSDKAYATPRTWEKAFRIYARPNMSLSVKSAAMSGCVGDGPVAQFFGFVDVWQSIQGLVPKIIKDPMSVDVPHEKSLCYALAVALSGEMTVKNVKNIDRFLQRLDAEFVMLAWMLAQKRDEDLLATDEYLNFAEKYKAVFANR